MSILLALIMAAEPSAECLRIGFVEPCVDVEIAPSFLIGTGPALPFLSMAVHRNGGVVVDWVNGITLLRRPGHEMLRPSSSGQLMYGLEDGRLLIRVPGRKEAYELWTWDGNSVVAKLGEASSMEALSAIICHAAGTTPATFRKVTNVACIGDDLIANDEHLGVVVWNGSRWIPTGARVGLWGVVNGAKLILTEETYDATREAFARASIATVSEPKEPLAVACGVHGCWALSKEREVLVLDLDTPVRRWRKIGGISGASYPAIKLQGTSERAVLSTGESCCPRFFYLGLPPQARMDRVEAISRKRGISIAMRPRSFSLHSTRHTVRVDRRPAVSRILSSSVGTPTRSASGPRPFRLSSDV